jgi:transglutaminase-like putative cysteine protease
MKKTTSRPLNALEQQQLSVALAITCLPHLLEQPWWLAATLGLILLTLSQLSADLRLRLPRYSHWLLGLLVGGLVFQAYSTLVGREGGVAVLMALNIVKLIETRSLRDARALFLLMFLLTGVAYLHSQTPWQAGYSLLATGVILFSAQRIEHNILQHRINLKATSRIILEGIPIAVLLFVLFPRLPAPLWAMPDPNSAQSGLSGEQMSPGSIGNMIQDESIAFRVQFNGASPSKSELYWRGPVFEDFDGERWRPAWTPSTNPNSRAEWQKSQFTNPPKLIGLGPSYAYTVTLEPHQQNWVLALDMPTQLPTQLALSNRLQVITPQPITERRRFDLSAQTRWITQDDAAEQIERSLRIPTDLNPRTQALAQQWRHLAPEQRVSRALQWLQQGGFSYTLSPPLLTSRHRIDEFLFQHKQGFCEHYASAFTVLMRSAGVPTRVVTGYQGATKNGNYWLVRQADAHAWVEVWLANRGWQRVDPTFVIAPTRINAGIARSVSNDQLPFMLREDHAWLRNLRLKADVMINGWNQWVVGYDQQRQNDLLKKLGIADYLSTAFLLWLIGGIIVTLGGFAAWLLYKNRPPQADLASRLYRRFCKQLRTIPTDSSEAPRAFAARAQLTYPELATEIDEITDLYLKARYGDDPQALAKLKQRVTALPQVLRRKKLSR